MAHSPTCRRAYNRFARTARVPRRTAKGGPNASKVQGSLNKRSHTVKKKQELTLRRYSNDSKSSVRACFCRDTLTEATNGVCSTPRSTMKVHRVVVGSRVRGAVEGSPSVPDLGGVVCHGVAKESFCPLPTTRTPGATREEVRTMGLSYRVYRTWKPCKFTYVDMYMRSRWLVVPAYAHSTTVPVVPLR
jgi:hypothetical protein